MEIYLTLAIILATYALSSVLTYSGGPWGDLETLRNFGPVKRFGLLDCFLCVSFYVAFIVTMVAYNFSDSGVAISTFFIAWGVSYILDQLIMAYKVK